MKLKDIIHNPNFIAEFLYVVRLVDDYGEPLEMWECWEKEVPKELMDKEVYWLNTETGNGSFSNEAVMVIDVLKEN